MKSRTFGFIMMEVLVALVLVTSVGISVVMWAESGLHSVARLQEEYARMRAIRLAQDWIRTRPFNPENKGEATLGNWKIMWVKEKLEENPQSGFPGGYGGHDIALSEYNYKVFQNPEDTQPWFVDSAIVAIPHKARSDKNPIF